ncbi:MAG: Lrp/AsnC family transcriptional regulator [Candidatus Obscuribacterales bacterium]|nr:Lrp/AsnC family transcriptional regulator [Candidatus Obscuribacterales bacterium]
MNNESAIEILEILSRDSRTDAETIATMTGLSLAEVKGKIEDFENRGVIKQYTATIDWEKAGVDKIVAFIDVKVVPQREVGFNAVAMRIARHTEVRSASLVSGGNDLRVVIETTHMNELAKFIAEKIATIDGVAGTNTHFLLHKYKEDYSIFEESEPDTRLVVTP